MGTLAIDAPHGGLTKAMTFGGQLKLLSGNFTFSSSYATGGESLDLSDYLKELLGIVLETKGGYVFEYDYAAKKVKALTPTVQHTHDLKITGSQAAGDALQVLAGVIGKTAAEDVTANGGASNIQNAAAAAATEVAAATNLSTIGAVRFLAWGW